MEGEHHAEHHIVHADPVNTGKKINWARIGIVLGAIVIIIAAYFIITSMTGKAEVADASSMKIEYSFELDDGKVLAENTSDFKPGKVGESFGFASSKLDDEIMKLKEGDEITITLEPEDAFGEYNESNVLVMNKTDKLERLQVQNRTLAVSYDIFTQAFSEEPEIGEVYESESSPWKYEVTAADNSSVNLSIDTKAGDFVSLNEIFYANITDATDSEITMLLGADDQTTDKFGINSSITSDDKYIYIEKIVNKDDLIPIGYFMTGKVLDSDDDTITVDLNGALAGEKVIVTIKILDVKLKQTSSPSSSSAAAVNKIEGAPDIELFVMSYCPFGIQTEKGILPAAKLLKDKINFEVKFVYYAMHGEKETDENTRQYCIQKEQNSKFIDYLECFLDSGESDSCLESAGIDKGKMESCISAADEEFGITANLENESKWLSGRFPLYDVYKEDNEKYEVGGSPTLIINGEETSSARDPESLKNAICNAFTEKPSECSEKLSSDSPTPQFGSGTQQASSGGGCGG